MRVYLLTLSAFISLALASTDAQAEDRRHFHGSPVSLGVGFGDPTAIDLKLWTTNHSGLDLGVGFNRFSERLGVYAEYELGLIDFWVEDSVEGVFYIGVGGAVALQHESKDTSVALIVPIGLNFRFRIPLEIFLEARPGVALLDSSGFGIGGQLGVRYVF